VSVQNNLPNADAGGNGAGTQEQRQEETTNYEISKTVRTLVREQPQIRRISLAVLVDGVEVRGPDGTPIWQPRTQEDLDRIARLVRSAVGYDEKRGDRIEVVNMRFAAEPEPAVDGAHKLLGMTLEGADVLRLSQTALFGIVALLAFLLVLRPMVVRLTSPNATGTLSAAAVLTGSSALPPAPAGEGPALLAGPEGVTGEIPGGLAGARTLLQSSEGERMLKLSNIEGQIRASSIRQLVDLVDRHPDESLAIVRAWMQQEVPQ
jgi:flagellar M-ring protein FliF